MSDISNLRFTEAEGSIETDAAVAGHLIADIEDRPAEDTPPYTAATLKAAFDYLATHVLGPRINALIDALLATADGSAGADSVGITAISGVTDASTVQEALEDLAIQVVDAELGEIQDYSLTDVKLSREATEIYSRFAAHLTDFASHFHYLGVTSGTTTAYTATDASFTFDTSKVSFLAIRAHAECGTAPTLAINGGTAYTPCAPTLRRRSRPRRCCITGCII